MVTSPPPRARPAPPRSPCRSNKLCKVALRPTPLSLATVTISPALLRQTTLFYYIAVISILCLKVLSIITPLFVRPYDQFHICDVKGPPPTPTCPAPFALSVSLNDLVLQNIWFCLYLFLAVYNNNIGT